MKKIVFIFITAILNARYSSHTPKFTFEGIEDSPFWWIPVVFIIFTFFYFSWKLITNKTKKNDTILKKEKIDFVKWENYDKYVNWVIVLFVIIGVSLITLRNYKIGVKQKKYPKCFEQCRDKEANNGSFSSDCFEDCILNQETISK